MAEKLRIHREIEKENARKLAEWRAQNERTAPETR